MLARHFLFAAILIFSCSVDIVQAGGIIKCRDASGRVQYSDATGLGKGGECASLRTTKSTSKATVIKPLTKDAPSAAGDAAPIASSGTLGGDFTSAETMNTAAGDGKAASTSGPTGGAAGGGGHTSGSSMARAGSATSQAGQSSNAVSGAKTSNSSAGTETAAAPATTSSAATDSPAVTNASAPTTTANVDPAPQPAPVAPAPEVAAPQPAPPPAATPKPAVPVISGGIPIETYGAKGDGVTDDSAAINRAILTVRDGTKLVFAAGKTYLLRKNIMVLRRGVKLYGHNATLRFSITDAEMAGPPGAAQESVQLLAPGTGIYGFTITSNLKRRLAGHVSSYGIYLSSDAQQVIDNRVEYTSVGILAYNATNFLISRNTVYRTFADGIHVTNGSANGVVSQNTVRENGDDMIAVVNYGAGSPKVTNILIEDNDVAGNYFGRGISVVGGRDITVRRNKIANTTYAAAIMVNAETSWDTANVDNVLIQDNDIAHVMTTQPAYNPTSIPRPKTGHGAIDINGQGAKKVNNVVVRNNTIHDVWGAAVLIRGNSCAIGLQGNAFSKIGLAAGVVINSDTSAGCSFSCTDNRKDGQSVTNMKCAGPMPTVVGASF